MRLDAPREGRRLLAAVGLLTRIPVPETAYDPDWLSRGSRYFPLVGIGIGALQGAVLLAGSWLWPAPVGPLLAIAAGLLLTGALHEDGFADTIDGFGGSTVEARLAIMADSRLGTYGAAALGLALALQVAALSGLPPATAAAALLAAGGGRLAAVVLMAALPYAGDGRKIRHDAGRPGRTELAIGGLTAALPLLCLAPAPALAGLTLGTAASALLAWRAVRGLGGGHTGDVLGAAIVAYGTGFLLGAAAFPRP